MLLHTRWRLCRLGSFFANTGLTDPWPRRRVTQRYWQLGGETLDLVQADATNSAGGDDVPGQATRCNFGIGDAIAGLRASLRCAQQVHDLVEKVAGFPVLAAIALQGRQTAPRSRLATYINQVVVAPSGGAAAGALPGSGKGMGGLDEYQSHPEYEAVYEFARNAYKSAQWAVRRGELHEVSRAVRCIHAASDFLTKEVLRTCLWLAT